MQDGTFEAQCKRVNHLVTDGHVTPEIGSLIHSYYTMGRSESTGDVCDVATYAKEHFNPEHNKTMLAYRTAKPAKLIVE